MNCFFKRFADIEIALFIFVRRLITINRRDEFVWGGRLLSSICHDLVYRNMLCNHLIFVVTDPAT